MCQDTTKQLLQFYKISQIQVKNKLLLKTKPKQTLSQNKTGYSRSEEGESGQKSNPHK